MIVFVNIYWDWIKHVSVETVLVSLINIILLVLFSVFEQNVRIGIVCCFDDGFSFFSLWFGFWFNDFRSSSSNDLCPWKFELLKQKRFWFWSLLGVIEGCEKKKRVIERGKVYYEIIVFILVFTSPTSMDMRNILL